MLYLSDNIFIHSQKGEKMRRNRFNLLILVLVLAVLFSACTPDLSLEPAVQEPAVQEPAVEEPVVEEPEDEEASSGTMLPEVNPLELSGDVVTAGSSTVFPLAERMAERFEDEGFAGNITIDSIGSGAGYERFCVAGETDIANASRPIKDEEVASCEAIGRTPIEFRIGTDALAVVVSAENDFLTDVTMEDLAMIFGEGYETWADVNPAWPQEEILRFIPGTDSGTFDFFVEEVFDENEEPHLLASNTQLSEDDNVLVQGILGSPYAIGYFGYAYYAENQDTLNILAIDGVEAVQENVDDNSYPLSRPLFMYSDAGILQEKPQVAGYLNFVLTYVNEEIVDVGYFPANEQALNTARQAWLDAMAGDIAAEEEPSPGTMLPAVNPLELSGDVVTAGSSTVFPLAERMAERFEDEGFAGNITIDSIGSGAGYERFCVAGETDIANASRPIKDEEVASCEAIGRTPIEFRIGTDALAVVVSAENDFLTDVTMEDLAMIFGEGYETWADVNPAWPQEDILRFIPGTDSGTFDFFVEEVFDENEEPHLLASNTQLSEDDNVLVQGILGSPYAIGYFGYAYYAENQDTLNILAIDGVEAVQENVDDNSYPLSRPLFMYSDAGILQEKPQVAGYLNFVLTFVNEEIVDVGYFPANDQALNNARQAWLDAMK
jgi:phosphate transport system substrate-binding protein